MLVLLMRVTALTVMTGAGSAPLKLLSLVLLLVAVASEM